MSDTSALSRTFVHSLIYSYCSLTDKPVKVQPDPTVAPATDPSKDPANVDPLARLDAEEEEEVAAVKRVPAVTLQIWRSILKPRGFELQEGKLIRSPSKSQNSPNVPPEVHDSPSKGRGGDKGKGRAPPLPMDDLMGPQAKPSVLASFRRSQSFAPLPKDSSTPKQPFQRATSSAIFAAPPVSGDMAQGGKDPSVASSSRLADNVIAGTQEQTSTGIFLGKMFRAMGEARSTTVRQAIEEAGGRVVSEGSDEDVDFVLVRLVRCVPSSLLSDFSGR